MDATAVDWFAREAYSHPGHLCNGLCPDTDEPGPDSRDPECFYCTALSLAAELVGVRARLDTAEKALRDIERMRWTEGLIPGGHKPAERAREYFAAAALSVEGTEEAT